MNDDFNARLRERLRNTDYPEPTKLRRLGPNPIIQAIMILVGVLGIIAAAIPTLLFSAIATIPAYMAYTLFSYF